MRKIITTAAVAAAALFVTASPASAADLVEPNSVNSTSVVNGSLYQQDTHPNVVNLFRTPNHETVGSWALKPGSIYADDLVPALQEEISTGRVTGVEADGPYPGATQLGDHPGNGSNSTETVPADGQVHGVWVKCAGGKTATGGGFRLAADAGTAAAKAVQVVASEPSGEAIEGDAAGSISPTGWLVEVVNSGTAAVIVRPWVICAAVS